MMKLRRTMRENVELLERLPRRTADKCLNELARGLAEGHSVGAVWVPDNEDAVRLTGRMVAACAMHWGEAGGRMAVALRSIRADRDLLTESVRKALDGTGRQVVGQKGTVEVRQTATRGRDEGRVSIRLLGKLTRAGATHGSTIHAGFLCGMGEEPRHWANLWGGLCGSMPTGIVKETAVWAIGSYPMVWERRYGDHKRVPEGPIWGFLATAEQRGTFRCRLQGGADPGSVR